MSENPRLQLIKQIAERQKLITSGVILNNAQKKIVSSIFKDGKRRILVWCGRSLGKTFGGNYVASRLSCIPRTSSYLIGPTRKQQKEICWEQSDGIKQFFKPELNAQFIETESRIVLPWQSQIKIDGSEMYNAYRGVAYDLMILDELQMHDRRFYDASFPNLSKRNGVLLCLFTTPEEESHWVLRLWEEAKKDEDWFCVNLSSWGNERIKKWLEHEKKKYYARGDIALWEREYEARFVPGGSGFVFPMFSHDRHVRPLEWILSRIERDKRNLEYWTSFDPGSSSVFAVMLIAINRHTSEIFVLDEIYEKDKAKTSTRQIWERVKEKEAFYYPSGAKVFRVYDEAAAWFQREMSQEFGVGLIPTQKATGEKEDDISMIKDSMLLNKIVFAEHCEQSIREIANYRTYVTESGKEKFKEIDDHEVDNLRYIYRTSSFSLNADVPIEEYVPANDNLWKRKPSDEEAFAAFHDNVLEEEDSDGLWIM